MAVLLSAAALQEAHALGPAPATVPHPAYNPPSPEKISLGKTLFFDKRLSGANDLACASCHQPAHGWEDGRAVAVGAGGKPRKRHTATLINRAWGKSFGWDGRHPTLEAFVIAPIANRHEMNQPLDALIEELRAVPGYEPLFAAAFPGEPMSIDHVSLSVAAFIRTITARQAPFDRWLAGDKTAMPADAIAGFRLFAGRAGCMRCHGGWNFTDEGFHDTGLPSGDRGRGDVRGGGPEKAHHFKTPTLRNIARRAPYMHDGSLKTLENVIDHYAGGFIHRKTTSPFLADGSLSRQEKLNLIQFLHMLSDNTSPMASPAIPE